MSANKLFSNFASPDLNPEFGILNDASADIGKAIKEVQDSFNKRVTQSQAESTQGSIKPLSIEEAFIQAEQIDQAIDKLNLTRVRLEAFSKSLDDQLINNGKITFKLNISKRRALRTATRQLYGEAKDLITYEMYKELKALKARMDKEETDEYVKGDWSNE